MGKGLVFGAIGSSALLLGALVGGWVQIPKRLLAAMLAFASGALITALAFDRPDLQNAARLAVLVTSVVAAGLGSAILLVRRRDPRPATD